MNSQLECNRDTLDVNTTQINVGKKSSALTPTQTDDDDDDDDNRFDAAILVPNPNEASLYIIALLIVDLVLSTDSKGVL